MVAIVRREHGIELVTQPFSSSEALPTKTDEEIVASKIVKAAAGAMATILPSMPMFQQVSYGIVLTPDEYLRLKVMVGDVLLLKVTKLQAR